MTNKSKDRWVILIAGIAMLLSTLDTGIINVALPFFKSYFHTTASVIAYSVTGYTIGLAIFILPFGLLGDKLGKLKIVNFGLLLFGVSSLICGFAINVEMLIAFRFIQGIGAAALQATSASLITTLVSKKNINVAMGVLGIMIGLGPVLGPSIGGFLLAVNAWRGIFWINVPFVVLGMIGAQLLIKKVQENKYFKNIDYAGSIVNAIGVITLILGLSLLSNQVVLALVFLVISLVAYVILYFIEKKKTSAIIDVKAVFNDKALIAYLFQTMVFGFASAMIFLLPPYLFEQVFKLNSGLTGLLVLGAPAGLVIFSRVSSARNDGTKNNKYSLVGLIIILLSLICLIGYNSALPYLLVTLFLFIYGIGGGYFQPANIALVMQAGSEESQGSIGSLQRMVQNIAIAAGTSIGSVFLNIWSNNLVFAIKIGWIVTLVLTLLAIISSVRRK